MSDHPQAMPGKRDSLRAVVWCAVSTKAQTEEDKHSLPQQEADALALCEREGWRVAAVLTVPGHSRRYVDIHELADHARTDGIDAFDRILDLWRREAFDVLICRDGDRFARTQSLHAYFVERTIDIGARIYSLADGWIDERNYRMWTSMSGYKSASHIDGLVAAKQRGMEKRMERGLNGGMDIPTFYRIVRDEGGKPLHLEFREEYRQMMDDAAELLLAGTGWKQFAVELYLRFGHTNPKTGQPYHDNSFYRWFHNPICWGVTAKGYRNKHGLWAFDENEPLPEGVKVNRKPKPPIPAVWTGETAVKVQAELRRRASVVKGRAKAGTKYLFTGLFVCAVCGRRFAADETSPKHLYWRCSAHTYRHYRIGQVCTNRRLLRNDVAQTYIDAILKTLLAEDSPDVTRLLSGNEEVDQRRRQIEQVRSQIVATNRRINRLIQRQADAPDNVADNYARQIEQAAQQLTGLENTLKQLESTMESPSAQKARQAAYDQIRRMGPEAFWLCQPYEINQILHELMGKHRFVVKDGEIIGIQ